MPLEQWLTWSNIIWLVVWTPLKNISHLGWLFPIYDNIWENKKCSKPPTRLDCLGLLTCTGITSITITKTWAPGPVDSNWPIWQGRTDETTKWLVAHVTSHNSSSQMGPRRESPWPPSRNPAASCRGASFSPQGPWHFPGEPVECYKPNHKKWESYLAYLDSWKVSWRS